MPRQSPETNGATPEAIARTALTIIKSQGPDALSFRAVAAELGVSHTTIARRCGDRITSLHDLCVEYLAGQLPLIPEGQDWAAATEARFTALYDQLVDNPGLVALRRGRPWLSPDILRRLVEPALAANLAAGMDPLAMIYAYRRMYLFTLGCAAFVNHTDPGAAVAETRTSLAALDPTDYPTLTGHLEVVLEAVVDHEVFRGGLRQLINAARPT